MAALACLGFIFKKFNVAKGAMVSCPDVDVDHGGAPVLGIASYPRKGEKESRRLIRDHLREDHKGHRL